MKVSYTFNTDDPHEREQCNRHHLADKMTGLLYELVNNDHPQCEVRISNKSSKAIREACWDAGIVFDDLWT